jgi:hypothetical protein
MRSVCVYKHLQCNSTGLQPMEEDGARLPDGTARYSE